MTEPEKNTTDPKPGETQGGGEMWLSPRARIVILILNSLGFAFFLAWLISLREQPIMREQEGILYFLPALRAMPSNPCMTSGSVTSVMNS